MAHFVGRTEQLAILTDLLRRVRTDPVGKPGRALLIRGRRRVGKSRLVEEFVAGAGVPHVYFTASTRSTNEELQLFVQEVAESDLPGAANFGDLSVSTWESAFRQLALALPEDSASVIVLDELPYLSQSDPSFEGTLQKVFDRYLSSKRVLIIGIGSDLAMMEALNEYGRPFHQRATEMIVPPLSPAEVGDLLALNAADAFDAYLVTGGLPLICDEWSRGRSIWEYLEEALANPTSALIVSAERVLAAEFPPDAQARSVLATIGSGERTFTAIGRAAGDLKQTSLDRSLKTLIAKRVVAADRPLSTKKPGDARYRVADSYLRFWLRFIGPHLPEIERGRGDRVLNLVRTEWSTWRGRAIEPVIREAVDRLPAGALPIELGVTGSYWTRSNDPEIDLVLADRAPIANTILGVGSIKWRQQQPFDAHDLAQLRDQRARLPGANETTPLFVVTRTGSTVSGVTVLTPVELLASWPLGQ